MGRRIGGIIFQKTGYDTKALTSNIALGIIDGVDSALWCYAFATIIFTSTLSVFTPVGLFTILVGWALVSLFVIATSKHKTHMVSIDSQAVVIIGSIGTLLIAKLGDDASSPEGLATMLAIMAITSFSVSASLYLVGRLRIARLLELIPYPVICGFMAGIAWLILDAGVVVATDSAISKELLQALQEDNNLFRLALCFTGGIGLIWFTSRVDGAWTLPVASLAIVIGFYAVVYWTGESKTSLVASGWLLDIDSDSAQIGRLVGELSLTDINLGFILSVIPQIASIVFLVLLGASMGISTLAAINFQTQISSTDEMKNLSGGNFLCGLVGSPPGCTDPVSSTIYEEFGASSRWMPIASSGVIVLIAFAGIGFISYMPKILVGATIFLFAIQMFNDWMYQNVRDFGPVDYLIVCFILVVIMVFGVVVGILAGIFLTALLFVLRYGLISAIQGQYTLNEHRSSVERSASSNMTLNRHGGEALVFTLRGFLFFGTTNAIRDAISNSIDLGAYTTILLDLRRVTGIDVSALHTFQQTRKLCEANNIQLLYSSVPEKSLDKILALDAVSKRNGEPYIFSGTDFAIECMEELILAKYAEETTTGSIHRHLADILGSEKKAQMISDLMERMEIGAGEFLFRQDDPDSGFYMLETGSLTAVIDDGDGGSLRVKKFSSGSIIGELSNYTSEKKRTASVVADGPSVLYHLDPTRLAADSPGIAEALSAIHEMVARTLSTRIDYMNRRLIKEIV